MNLSELPEDQLTNSIESVLSATTDFLGIELEYDYEIVKYTTGTGEDRELLKISLKGGQDSLLIGYHGRTLESIQHVISLALADQFKQVVRVQLDINDYRGKRQSSLENLARRAAQQVLESGQEMELQPMNAAERRLVHQVLNDEGKVKTESIGEGDQRRIVIKPITE